MARNNLLSYPYPNEQFEINTGYSGFQLVLVISQEVKPIALYGRKLRWPKKLYVDIKWTAKHCLSFEIVLNYITISTIKNPYWPLKSYL